MCIWTHPHSRRQGKISLEGYTPAKMAGVKIEGMGRQPEAGGDGLNEKNRLFDPPFETLMSMN